MTKKALTQMGKLLAVKQTNRALTDREVVDQLNRIQDEEAHDGRVPEIAPRTWQYWKHGQKEPWPRHLRVLATWTRVPVTALRRGDYTVKDDLD